MRDILLLLLTSHEMTLRMYRKVVIGIWPVNCGTDKESTINAEIYKMSD